MKKTLFIAIMAIFTANFANAQNAEDLSLNGNKTISVAASQAPVIEKLFTAWGKEFPGEFVEIFNTFKKTGKTNNQGLYDYKVDYAPKNGFIEIYGSHSFTVEVDGNYSKGDVITKEQILQAVYWNLANGNKLLGVSIRTDGEIFSECAVAFYEYNAAKGTLTPRADVNNNVLEAIGHDSETFVKLPKAGRDLKFVSSENGAEKTIKWNGNGF